MVHPHRMASIPQHTHPCLDVVQLNGLAQQVPSNKLLMYMQRPQILLSSEILHLNLESTTKNLDKIRKKIKCEARCLDSQMRGAEISLTVAL